MIDLYKQQKNLKTPNKPVNITEFSAQEQDPKARKRANRLEEILQSLDLQPKTRFDDLHGIESVKEQVIKNVDRFKRAIDEHAKKSKWPILICGSQGLGKTSLVEAAANYAKIKLVSIQLVNLVEQTRSEFKDSLEHLVRHSITNQPSIVLIDNLEQIADKEECRYLIRGTIRRLLDDQLKILIFCSTSATLDSVSEIDFSRIIHLKRPSLQARLDILKSLQKDNGNLLKLSEQCLHKIALNTPSFTARDLKKMIDIAETESDGEPNLANCETAMEIVKQSFKRGTHLIGERPQVTWNNIGGMSDVRADFLEIIRQTRRSDRNCKFAGIALYGPPGCGKTMVAQAMANEAGFNFISIKPAELVDKFLGETEKNIRRVFHEAREHEPCMIYFDEFDGLCGTRGNRDSVTSAIQTLLSEMDGFVSRGQSIILASTNRLEDIDPAMKRPGRLSKHIYVGPPDEKSRNDIFRVTTSKPWLQLSTDVDLSEWARETEHFTGADIDFMISEAEARALVESSDAGDVSGVSNFTSDNVITLKKCHFDYAINKIRTTNRELDKKTRSSKRTKLDDS